MAKRIDKVAKAAHIKRNTEGTSNEISFSVLDAAKNSLDGEGNSSPFGTISLFTLPGKRKSISTPSKDEGLALTQREVSPSSARSQNRFERRQRRLEQNRVSGAAHGSHSAREPRSFDAEVASRKRARKRGRLIVSFALTVALLAVAGGLTWWGFGTYQDQQTYKGVLSSAISELSGTDELLAEIDAVVVDLANSDVTSLSLDDTLDVQKKVQDGKSTCIDELDAAEEAVGQVAINNSSDASNTPDSKVVDTITARRQMLTSGATIIDDTVSVLQARQEVTKGWQLVLAADGLAREAADIASSATSADMQASTEKSQQAIESFSKAKTALQNAEQLFPQLDLSAYMSYIDKRLEAQGYAIESNDALINRDTQAATEHNDAYNNAEKQAGELAEKLPEDPDELVVDAFNSKTASSREMYENARSQAQSADAFIRDYLGTFNK